MFFFTAMNGERNRALLIWCQEASAGSNANHRSVSINSDRDRAPYKIGIAHKHLPPINSHYSTEAL